MWDFICVTGFPSAGLGGVAGGRKAPPLRRVVLNLQSPGSVFLSSVPSPSSPLCTHAHVCSLGHCSCQEGELGWLPGE